MKSLLALTCLVLICLHFEPCKADWGWCNCPESDILAMLDRAISSSGLNARDVPSDCVDRTAYVLRQLEADARHFERGSDELRALEDEIYSRSVEMTRSYGNSLESLNRLINFHEQRDRKDSQLILVGESEEIKCAKFKVLLEEELQDLNRTNERDQMKLDELKRQIHDVTKKNKALEAKL